MGHREALRPWCEPLWPHLQGEGSAQSLAMLGVLLLRATWQHVGQKRAGQGGAWSLGLAAPACQHGWQALGLPCHLLLLSDVLGVPHPACCVDPSLVPGDPFPEKAMPSWCHRGACATRYPVQCLGVMGTQRLICLGVAVGELGQVLGARWGWADWAEALASGQSQLWHVLVQAGRRGLEHTEVLCVRLEPGPAWPEPPAAVGSGRGAQRCHVPGLPPHAAIPHCR